jgi:hypothetical protein
MSRSSAARCSLSSPFPLVPGLPGVACRSQSDGAKPGVVTHSRLLFNVPSVTDWGSSTGWL